MLSQEQETKVIIYYSGNPPLKDTPERDSCAANIMMSYAYLGGDRFDQLGRLGLMIAKRKCGSFDYLLRHQFHVQATRHARTPL